MVQNFGGRTDLTVNRHKISMSTTTQSSYSSKDSKSELDTASSVVVVEVERSGSINENDSFSHSLPLELLLPDTGSCFVSLAGSCFALYFSSFFRQRASRHIEVTIQMDRPNGA